MSDAPPSRDPYGRKTISTSRGKTHDRIMALQHAPGVLPGAEDLLAITPTGSIGAGVIDFVATWLPTLKITSRRAYERSLVLLLRDIHDTGPGTAAPVGKLSHARLREHLDWRVANRLDNADELLRCTVHLTRLAGWLDEHHGAAIAVDRADLRARAELLGR